MNQAITQLSLSPRGRRALDVFAELHTEMCCLDTANRHALADLFELSISDKINGTLTEALSPYKTK